MAAKRWKGGAGLVAQVSTLTVGGTAANGQVYTVTIGLNSISYTATGADTNNTIAAALQALLSASTFGELSGITWTVVSAVITATSGTAGTPFTVTTSATGTGTFVTATTTANGSPNDWTNAANWDVGAVPVTGDDVYLDATSYDIWWNLNQSAVTLSSLTITSTFQTGAQGAGTLGLPEVNTSSQQGYVEYRPTYLQIGATTCTIGDGLGQGSQQLKIDFGSVQTACTVHATGAGADATLEALLLKGTHASNVFTIVSGSVAIGPYGGDAPVIATLNVGSAAGGAPSVRVGPKGTVTTLNMEDGTVLLGGGVTTVNKIGGTLTILAGNVTTLNERGGSTAYLGVGTIGTLLVGTGGAVDFSQDIRGRNVTTCTLYPGATLTDPYRTVTWANPITLSQASLQGPEAVTIDLGKNITLTPVNL